jgi:hypothetical protein
MPFVLNVCIKNLSSETKKAASLIGRSSAELDLFFFQRIAVQHRPDALALQNRRRVSDPSQSV